MKTLISTIIKSMEHTLSILNVQLMLIFVCASFSYVYWANTLEYRCMDIDVSHLTTSLNLEIVLGKRPKSLLIYIYIFF